MQSSQDSQPSKGKTASGRIPAKIESLKAQMALENLAIEYWGIEYARSEYGHPLDSRAMIRDCKESIEVAEGLRLKKEEFLNLLLSIHFGIEATKIKDCEYVESYDPRFADRWILSFDTDSEVLTDILREEIEQSAQTLPGNSESTEAELNTFDTKQDAYSHSSKAFNLFERYCLKMYIKTDAEFEAMRG